MHFLMPEKCKCCYMNCTLCPCLIQLLVALTNEFYLSNVDHEVKIKQLHAQLESLVLRWLKRDVLTSPPTKSEHILCVEMSAMQIHFYKNILTKASCFIFIYSCATPDLCRFRILLL